MITIKEHPCKEVQQAIIRLADALCSWERDTGIQSVLIIREEDGYFFRASSGKPTIPDDIPDELILKRFGEDK
jgi:hypothetical protein